MIVSIRAPAKGATRSSEIGSEQRECFDPRSREGSDTGIRDGTNSECGVSIRAPAKGATCVCEVVMSVQSVSIRAPAKGATWFSRSMRSRASFRSALPRRERPPRNAACRPRKTFRSALPRRERRPTDNLTFGHEKGWLRREAQPSRSEVPQQKRAAVEIFYDVKQLRTTRTGRRFTPSLRFARANRANLARPLPQF